MSRPHLVFLDCLRALAALYVLVHHAFTLSMEYHFFDGVSPVVQKVASLSSAGHIAVDLFIVLSGFSLMLAVLRKEQVPAFLPFLGRRAQRILPPYYAAVALPILVHIATRGYLLPPGDTNAWPIAAHVLLIHDLFTDTWGRINNVLWSVSVEWRIYLLFPFFSYLFLKFGIRVLLIVASIVFAVAVGVCVALNLPQVYNWTGICPQYVVLFALGMACSAIRFSDVPKYAALRARVERLPWRWYGFGVLLAVFLLQAKAGVLWKLFGPAGIFVHDLIAGCLAAVLLLCASYTGTPRNLFGNKRLAGVGLMAYSIYLFHYPALQLAANLVRDHVDANPLRLLLLYTVGITFAYGGSCLFFLYIERPFALLKKKV